MSGGGSGSGYEAPVSNMCETLGQETILNSPDQAIVKALKKGDRLEIRVIKSGNTSIVQALNGNKVAGSITSSIIQRLVQCVAENHEYEAEVIDNVTGGACKVHVHHK